MGKPKLNKRAKKSLKIDTYHHGDLRTTLIETALKILKTQSPESISLRELARKAGVSQAAPYRHFKDKNELLAAISEQGFQLKCTYMKEAIERYADNPLEMYYAFGKAYFKMGKLHPQHFRLMVGSQIIPCEQYPKLLETAAKSYSLLVKMIKICQKAKIIGEGDPFHKALNCWCVVNGFTALYADNHLAWLGITQENADDALTSLLSQYLIGNSQDLEKSAFGFKPFQTPESLQNKLILDLAMKMESAEYNKI
jgi:AcrR family transcriptional regulator